MKKPYSGNEKPYILALFHDAERKRVMPVLEILEKSGLELYGFDGKIRKYKAIKACTFVAFLSERFGEDPMRQAMIALARLRKIPVIAVRLDGSEQPKALEELLSGQEEIRADGLSAEELASRISQTEFLDPPAVTSRQKLCARIRLAILSGAVLAAIIAGVVSFGSRTFGWFSPAAKRLMLRSWMRGDLTLLEQLLH